MKQIAGLFALLIAVMLAAYWLSQPGALKNLGLAPSSQETSRKETRTITVGQTEFQVEIAKTDQERSQGLAGREDLGSREGMLFVFEEENQRQSFWMKGVRFPIDIIWIDDGKVVEITTNIPTVDEDAPADKIPFYVPKQPIDFVLEIGGGEVANLGIKIGDPVILPTL